MTLCLLPVVTESKREQFQYQHNIQLLHPEQKKYRTDGNMYVNWRSLMTGAATQNQSLLVSAMTGPSIQNSFNKFRHSIKQKSYVTLTIRG